MENLLSQYSGDSAKKLDIVSDIRKKYASSKAFYHEKRKGWEDFYKIYHKIRDDKDSTNEVDLKLSHPYALVENLVARVAQPALGKLTIEVKPKRDDHATQAENFYNICRSYFSSADYRVDFVDSVRERIICGSAWEFDDWANDYEDGMKWDTSLSSKVVDMEIPVISGAAKVVRDVFFKDQREVAHKFPVNVGYKTIFPSIFSVFPQPNIQKMRDLKWVIREIESIPVDDLRKAQYRDGSGNLVPVYDLTEIDKLVKSGKVVKPVNPDTMDYARFRREYEGAAQEQANSDGAEKESSVYLQLFYTGREKIVVANGIWVIQHIKDSYHKPGIKCRLRVYTQNPHSIYGTGAIEPVREELEMMDDFYNLGMQNQVRIVNRMLIYDEEAIPYPDDFTPRAGGRVRAKSGTNLAQAVLPIQQTDTIPTIINVLSELKGIVEATTSVSDFIPSAVTPGHKTYGGLMEMQSSFAKRFSLVMLIEQSSTMKQMDEMYWLFEQFMFDEIKFSNFRAPSGSKAAVSYKREDIDTQGEGFIFTASDDPSFGDSQIQRNQMMVLMELSLNYEKVRAALNKTEWKTADCGEVLEKIYEVFGKDDTTKWLKYEDGSVDPEKEYALMLQGIPVQVNPRENLTWHLIKHFIQKKKLEASQMNQPPQTIILLTNHISDTMANIQAVATQPEMFAMQYAQSEGLKMMGREMGSSQINLGQTLPQSSGASAGGLS